MQKILTEIRYTTLFMLLLLGMISSIQAQDHASLMGGLNKNNFIVTEASFFENEDLNLFFVGLSLEEEMGQHWKFNTFIQYIQKGGKLQVPSSSFLIPSNIRMQYIDLVPSLEYKVLDVLGIYGGGTVGYLIRSDQKIKDSYQKLTQEYFEKVTYGWIVGIKIYAGNSGFNLHYERGLKNLISDDGDIPSQGFELFQQSFQLGFTLYL